MPTGCSSNNSRVAEVHVYGSYAREHITPFLFFFFGPEDRIILIFCSRSMGRIGVLSGVCAGHYVDGVRTTSQTLGRRPSYIDSSSMQYGPLAHLPSTYFMLTWAFWFPAYRCVHSRPSRIPLSAFIVEDMAELARAHATYRFVILDEEEERPRILVRIFSEISTQVSSS
jgi:hypothetical protein